MPYTMRDQINWSTGTAGRLRAVTAIGALYGAVILVCAFTRY
jgi:hypothetical protein